MLVDATVDVNRWCAMMRPFIDTSVPSLYFVGAVLPGINPRTPNTSVRDVALTSVIEQRLSESKIVIADQDDSSQAWLRQGIRKQQVRIHASIS